MPNFGNVFQKRRQANAAAIQQAFGVTVADPERGRKSTYRTIREGGPVVIFTIGYEKRDGDGLISLLRDAGIELLADIREKPVSRVADFRVSALRGFCENAGIEYRSWPELGSTDSLRDALKTNGDLKDFQNKFRRHVLKYGQRALNELAIKTKQKSTALLCYERLHEDCHRSTVAELLADKLGAGIVAL